MPRGVPQASSRCVGPRDLPGQEGEGICGRPVVGLCLCGSHNRRFQRKGTLARTRATMRPRQLPEQTRDRPRCGHEDGCPKPEWVKGWCSMHYLRILRHGHPGPVGALRDGSMRGTCRHPGGCSRPGNAGDGWCTRHKLRVATTGDPGPAKERLIAWSTPYAQQRRREAAGHVLIEGDR